MELMSDGKDLKTLFGLRVAKLRTAKGITQEQLSELASISPRMMSRIETGANFTQAETIEKIAEALDTDVRYLLRFDEPDLENEEELLKSIDKKINFLKNDLNKLKLLNEIMQKFF